MYEAHDSRAPVPAIASKDGSRNCTTTHNCAPNYQDLTYQGLLRKVHVELASELRILDAIGKVVIAFQPCVGSTGDDTPVHLDQGWQVLDQRALDSICPGGGSCGTHSWWANFTRSFATSLATDDALFGREVSAGKFSLLLNAQGDSFGGLDSVAREFSGSLLKFGQSGHEYQSNYERIRASEHANYVYSLQAPIGGGQRLRPIRSRAELSAATCWTSTGPYFDPVRCPVKSNVLAMSRWVAAVHLDYWNIQPSSIQSADDTYDPIWRFLNRYSGLRWPQQSTGVWISFRDGLDGADLDRFDAATYGELVGNSSHVSSSKKNVERAAKVCAQYAKQGCQIDSNRTLGGGPISQRRQDGMNDVAFSNWRGDYANFISQIEPIQTRGWWRVGMSSASFFGRFARGWKDPSDNAAVLALQIDSGMWGGLPLAKAAPVDLTLRVVFLDRGSGQFSLHYDSHGSDEATVAVVKKRGSGEWQEICLPLDVPRFGRGPHGADVWLTNDDQEDDIWDSLEISTETAESMAINGCDGREG